MRPVTGIPKEPTLFGRLEAVDVLAWYDGLRTFTLRDGDGGLCLAHWLDEDIDAMRFVVVPVSEPLLDRLRDGTLAVREILDQPRVYLAEQENSGRVRGVWLVQWADLPQEQLPAPGVVLHRPTGEQPVTAKGLVRELDADELTFRLRGDRDGPDARRVYRFDGRLWNTVHELLGSSVQVQVVGRPASAGVLELTELSRVSG